MAFLAFAIETALAAFSTSRRVNSRSLSQAVLPVEKGQDGSDAGPESFELRVFLQGLRQKQHGSGAAWGFGRDSIIETVLTQKSSQRYCLQDVAILTQGKGCSRLQPSCQLDFQQLEMAYLVMSSPICPSCLPHRNCSYSFQHIQPSSRTFSQAVPKHCQWKIEVRIRASSRGQDGSDAGPESFELRVFL